MPYGNLNVDVVQSSTAGTPVQFNDGNGTQVGTLCRAWVNFNGVSGSVAIRASFNVSSITRNGTGDYTVTFTNALSDANYSTIGTSNSGGDTSYNRIVSIINVPTTSAVRFVTNYTSNVAYDVYALNVAVFR